MVISTVQLHSAKPEKFCAGSNPACGMSEMEIRLNAFYWLTMSQKQPIINSLYIYIYIYIHINKCIYYKFSYICFDVLQKDQLYEDGGEFFEIYNQHMIIACSA